MNNYLTLLIIVVVVQLSRAQNKCSTTSKPHLTECNKYLKCIDLSGSIQWVAMKCEEGLVYDKHLLSCAIPDENFECLLEIDGDINLDSGSREFLEVIDDGFQIKSKRGKSELLDEDDDSSGDGDDLHASSVTSSPSTVRMITTQLQRLTQLVKHVQDEHNGVVNSDELTPNELNTFLSVQKIQTQPPSYDSLSYGKTSMSKNGEIHPEILSDILDQQTELNNRLTTLSMDESPTTKIPIVNPTQYMNKLPSAASQINLKSRVKSEGYGPHQIIVNRPEGSVLFNVPTDHQKEPPSAPFLSRDILRSILEISKHMAKQNQQEKQNPQTIPHPIYYAVPVPIYYGNNSTNFANNPLKVDTVRDEIFLPNETKAKTKKKNNKKTILLENKIGDKSPSLEYDTTRLKNYQQQQQAYQNYLNGNPNYFYNSYQQQPFNYQHQQQQHPFSVSNYPGYDYSNQNSFDSSFYGVNRPFVIESSAPTSSSYDYYKPKRESYESSSSFESIDGDEKNDDDDGRDDILYDFNDSSSREDEKPQKEELICSIFLQRQANKTDCFKYYVCNAKTKEVITYTCPSFTSFNDVTKYCDAESYSNCKKINDAKFQSQQNQKIYNEAHAAIAQVKRQSQKVERIANRMKQKMNKRKIRYPSYSEDVMEMDKEVEVPNSYSSYYQPQNTLYNQEVQHYQRLPEIQKLKTTRKPTRKINPVLKSKPQQSPQSVAVPARKKSTKKKKRVKCNGIGNIVDPESPFNYWHCFVGQNKKMMRIRRQCTSNFIFCPSTKFCTKEELCK